MKLSGSRGEFTAKGDDDTEGVYIPRSAAFRLPRERDGNLARLYIYLTANGFSMEGAAKELGMSAGALQDAAAKLAGMGLIDSSAKLEETVLPDYSRAEMARFIEEDKSFYEVFKYAQELYGRILSEPDIGILLRIYSYLSFTPDAIMMLISFCAEQSRQRGKGLPSFKQVEREALKWERDGVTTGSQADRYLVGLRRREDEGAGVLSLIGLDRQPTQTQKRYVDSWLDMGFSPDMIYSAYDITVVRTGGLKWEYMNRILTNWHDKGIATQDDIKREKEHGVPSKGKADDRGTSIAMRPGRGTGCRYGAEEMEAVKRARDKARDTNPWPKKKAVQGENYEL